MGNTSARGTAETSFQGKAPAVGMDDFSASEFLDVCPVGALLVGSDWRIEYFNREGARLLGKNEQELLGETLWSALPEAVDRPAEKAFRHAMGARVATECELPLSPDMWRDLKARPYKDGLALYIEDISEAKRADLVGRSREAELRDFLENANVAFHWVGPDGTILWANSAEMRLLGYSPEEYIGKNIRAFHADPPVIEDILQRLGSGKELNNYRARLRCKDGSIRLVAIHSSVYRRHGEFVHTRCFTRDLLGGEDAEMLQRRLAAIVESSEDAVISKDLRGIIQSWNGGAERLFGYTAEEAIGQPVAMLAVPERRDEIPDILDRIKRGERVEHYRTLRQSKTGKVLSISLTVSPIHDASGAIIGASKVARDVTLQTQTEQALQTVNESLERSNADLQQFVYSASHDLQEPLRTVATYSQMLQRKFGEQLGRQGQEYVGYLVDGAKRMETLLSALRNFTRASTSAEEPTEDLDANEVLARTLVSMKATIEANGAKITYDSLPKVKLHAFQLEQLFLNLIGNGIRYRGEAAPFIHVGAQRIGKEWTFSVRDNGIGIEPKYQEQIFGIFKRLHTYAEYPGTGMGLAICERIVQRAGGRIWVESEPGRGSTFFFTIPA